MNIHSSRYSKVFKEIKLKSMYRENSNIESSESKLNRKHWDLNIHSYEKASGTFYYCSLKFSALSCEIIPLYALVNCGHLNYFVQKNIHRSFSIISG